MRVAIIKFIAALMFSSIGIMPAWCDSCGEMYNANDMTHCETCGATICPICEEYYPLHNGCFVCNDNV